MLLSSHFLGPVTFLFTLSDTEISGLCNTTDDEGQQIIIDVTAQQVISRTDLGGRVTTSTGAGQDGVLTRPPRADTEPPSQPC